MATVTNARVSVGALFGAVTNAAGAVASVLDASTKGVSMLENYVGQALRDQKDRMAATATESAERISEEMATDLTDRQQAVLNYCTQSASHAEMYERNYSKIRAMPALR